jgi:hypothetical protein
MPIDPIWEAPPLSAEDQQLLEAYLKAGRSLDDLPYTQDFEDLFHQLNRYPDTQDARHFVFQRLLRLRKTGRLPRVGRSSAEAF